MSQRQIADMSGFSLGKVNSSLKEMYNEGYLNQDYSLTAKTLNMYHENQPRRAIILAAGLGMRMVPINLEVSKGLLEVEGECLIEHLIRQLKEASISEIIVVVGFMKEQYEYLIDKYGVELVYNKEYAQKNNLHSLNLVRNKLDNAYIVPCDLWCRENPFSTEEISSWYMVNNNLSLESNVRVTSKMELQIVSDNMCGNTMLGIAYITPAVATILKKHLRDMAEKRRYYQSFWEEAAIQQKKMIFSPNIVDSDDVIEINTFEQLRELDNHSNHLNSYLMDVIQQALKCESKDIVQIESLKKGMTNRSFRFYCKGKRYIMRVPGEGTDLMINRTQEYNVYNTIKDLGICDPVIYLSRDKGYKITEFLEGARNCDAESIEDVKKCMIFLRKFHEMKLTVNHSFNIFEQIEKYESYWEGEPSIFRDYAQTKNKMYELKEYIDSQEKEWTLTHIDAVPDNFLFVQDKIYLIDWEYSGMQDPHVDIAMFAIYSMYNRKQVENLIDAYFNNECPQHIRVKIYCYIAVCGFLWSNWCEYKRICGVEFGEYSLRQYRFAKEYYTIAKEHMNHE